MEGSGEQPATILNEARQKAQKLADDLRRQQEDLAAASAFPDRRPLQAGQEALEKARQSVARLLQKIEQPGTIRPPNQRG